MRARLAFALSMGLPFDLYLVDEVTAVGDTKFRAKSAIAFKSRMENAGAIMVSHNMDQLRNLCSRDGAAGRETDLVRQRKRRHLGLSVLDL